MLVSQCCLGGSGSGSASAKPHWLGQQPEIHHLGSTNNLGFASASNPDLVKPNDCLNCCKAMGTATTNHEMDQAFASCHIWMERETELSKQLVPLLILNRSTTRSSPSPPLPATTRHAITTTTRHYHNYHHSITATTRHYHNHHSTTTTTITLSLRVLS